MEEAVLEEFDRINDRGGVLGAMETQYQRGKIQEESMYYEMLKHSGELPIIGVNTYLNPNPPSDADIDNMEIARASTEEKRRKFVIYKPFGKHMKRKVKLRLHVYKKWLSIMVTFC